MKIYTTNYFDTFIGVADDTKDYCRINPPAKDCRIQDNQKCKIVIK